MLVAPTATVGSGCLIGPDVSIGDGCVIGDGVRLSNCVVMRGVRVKDHSKVSGLACGAGIDAALAQFACAGTAQPGVGSAGAGLTMHNGFE